MSERERERELEARRRRRRGRRTHWGALQAKEKKKTICPSLLSFKRLVTVLQLFFFQSADKTNLPFLQFLVGCTIANTKRVLAA